MKIFCLKAPVCVSFIVPCSVSKSPDFLTVIFFIEMVKNKLKIQTMRLQFLDNTRNKTDMTQ